MNRTASASPLTRFAQLLMAMMMSALLAACGGGGGKVGLPTGINLFTTAPASVALNAGGNSTYTIGGGNPTYSASSSNRDVATVSVSGTSVTIAGVGSGTAIITITDAVGAAVNVPVSVAGPTIPTPTALFSTAPSSITLAIGATGAYTISGGTQPYTVVSNNTGVARVALTGTNFVVTAVTAGTAQIVITDTAGATLNVAVTVTEPPAGPPLFSTAPPSVTLVPGGTALYAISGGQAPYAVASSAPGVARVALSGNDFVVTGVANGTALLVITDAKGAALNLSVTVGTVAPTALFTTAPAAITLAPGATGAYVISGGTPAYSVVSSNAGVARVALSGTNYVVTAVSPGAAQLLVSDTTGATLSVAVTVSEGPAPTALFTTAPSALTLAPGASALYAISGGQAPYAITSSAPGVGRVALSGSDFVVTAVAAGTAQLQISDARGAALTLSLSVVTAGATPLFITAPATVNLAINGSAAYRIGGGAPAYDVSSSNTAVARVAINGSDFVITGMASGVTQIQVTDTLGEIKIFTVTVGSGSSNVDLFTTAPSAVRVPIGGTAVFTVGGGRAPYFATSSDTALVATSLAGTSFAITGVRAGEADVRITDADGKALNLAVTAGAAGTTISLFTTAPSAVSVAAGATTSYAIGGGKPAYAVSSSNIAVARVTLSGSDYTITGVSAGTAQIRISDINGDQLSVAVTVGGDSPDLFVTAPDAVSVAVGATAAFQVGGGKPAYIATSNNTAIARVTLNGSDLVITGVANGVATLTIADTVGARVILTVTVGSGTGGTAFYTTAPDNVTIAVAASASYVVGGGLPSYAASSSNLAVAQFTLVAGNLTITGVAPGNATILVVDSAGAREEILVTVPDGRTLYTSAQGTVTLPFGSTHTYAIGGGAGGYGTTSSNPGVATASVAGSVLTVTAVAPGNAQVVVTDQAGAQVLIAVTVSPAAAPLAVSPGSATGNVGDTLTFIASGGTAPFTVTINNTNIATASTAGSTISVVLNNVGVTSATVTDARGESVIVPITSEQVSPVLRLSPSALLVAENSVDTITLNIYGGTGPYRAFTSDQTLSSVSIVGSTVLVAVGSNTNRCVNTYDSSGAYVPNGIFDVTVTVLDSLGASATGIMSIKDNGAGVSAGCP